MLPVKLICFFGGLMYCSVSAQQDPIQTVFEWNTIEYLYDSDEERQQDIDSGYYVPNNSFPIDVDVHYSLGNIHEIINTTYFMTVHRYRQGIPSTLNIITNEFVNGQRGLKPFPNINWARDPEDCKENRIVSAYRIKVDSCGTLWVLDSGRISSGTVCAPQVLAFHLHGSWETPTYRYEFPETTYSSGSFFDDFQLDQGHFCRTRYIYISDSGAQTLVVLDTRREQSWRLDHPSMKYDPDFTSYNVDGESLTLHDGIYGMAMTPWVGPLNIRYLLYSALAGEIMYRVDVRDLRRSLNYNESQLDEIIRAYPTGRGDMAGLLSVTRNGIALFSLVNNSTIDCWNTFMDDYGPNIHELAPAPMNFVSATKLQRHLFGEMLLMVSRSKLWNMDDFSVPNFRVSAANVDHLLHGSACERIRLSDIF